MIKGDFPRVKKETSDFLNNIPLHVQIHCIAIEVTDNMVQIKAIHLTTDLVITLVPSMLETILI